MMWNGGFNPEAMWGPPGDPAWARNDPTVQAGRLAANGTRIWIYCGNATQTDPALASPDAPIGGLGGSWKGWRSNPTTRSSMHTSARVGTTRVFNFPEGIHSWGYAGRSNSR